MFRLRTTLLVSAFALLLAASGYANTILVANLTNSQENPPTNPMLSTGGPRPASFGTATFDLNDAMTAMTFSATAYLGDADAAELLYEESLELNRALGNQRGVALSVNSLAARAVDQGDFERAEGYFEECLGVVHVTGRSPSMLSVAARFAAPLRLFLNL